MKKFLKDELSFHSFCNLLPKNKKISVDEKELTTDDSLCLSISWSRKANNRVF